MLKVTKAPLLVALMTLMNPVGTMVGFVIPYAFVNTSKDTQTVQNQFGYFMMASTGSALIVLWLSILFFEGEKIVSINIRRSITVLGPNAGTLQPQSYEGNDGPVTP